MEVNDGLTEELYDHGMSLNPRNDRVQCNYCGLVVAGFDCLQAHLGGTIGKSPGCQSVPSSVKELCKSGLNIVEEKNLLQKAENLCKADCSANTTPNSNGDNRKRGKTKSPRNDGPKGSKRVYKSNSVSSALNSSAERKMLPNREEGCQSVMIKRWICRFLIENAIDFDAANSYSFRKMLEVVSHASDITCHAPSIQELKGSIYSDEMEETKICVDSIRKSWSKTGCSIVLDGWINDRNRNLMIVIADCPIGAVYIDSFDITTLVEDVEGFQLLLEGVLEQVGIQNVVQFISHTSSGFMNDVGKRLSEKHRSLFWSVSASHCVALILDKIGTVSTVKQVLDKAKTITKFIYSQADALKLMRSHTHSFDLIKSSKVKAVMPFLTLENILMEREKLKKLVSSSEWLHSSWASNVEGRRVADLIHDKPFWDKITVVVRATIPLVKALSLINGDGDPHVGFIYETMDQVKEIISEELKLEKTYKPYWDIIDDIWDNILHIPLHAAGYFLNPRFLYTEDFSADSEVLGGLLTTIMKMVEDLHTQDLISKQVKVYQNCEGAFKKGTENEKHDIMSPAAWWSSYGSHCPDLQKLAVRILSQSCNGAESYGLKKDVAEKLVSNGVGTNDAEKQQLRKLAYVHYNMNLKQRKLGAKCEGQAEEIDLNCDWIMEEEGPMKR